MANSKIERKKSHFAKGSEDKYGKKNQGHEGIIKSRGTRSE